MILASHHNFPAMNPPGALGPQIHLSTPESFEFIAQTNAKHKRMRKVHTKVRTGCRTCKARKKKCDEAKPFCLACTTTGRKCEGYASDITKQTPPLAEHLVAPAPSTISPTPKLRLPSVSQSPTESTIVTPPQWSSTIPFVTIRHDDDYNIPVLNAVDKTNDVYVPQFLGIVNNLPQSTDALISDSAAFSDTASASIPAPFDPQQPPSFSTHPPFLADGHAPNSVLPAEQSMVPNTLMSPSTYQPVTDVQRHCFDYFRYQTGPTFASYFNSSVFEDHIVQMSMENPVVFACAAALGAVHRRHEYGISREGFEYCGHAARLHNRALTGLVEYKALCSKIHGPDMMRTYHGDAMAMSEVLLSVFESFQDGHEKTVEHVQNAMHYLLDRPMTLLHRESHYCTIGPNSNVLRQLEHRLCRSAHLIFRTPLRILARPDDGSTLPVIPPRFESLEEARDFVVTEYKWVRNRPVRDWRDAEQKRLIQKLHLRRLSQWSVSYAELVKTMDKGPKSGQLKLMKITRNTANMLCYMMLTTDLDTKKFAMPHTGSNETRCPAEMDQDEPLTTDMLWQLISERQDFVVYLTSVNVMAESNLDETHMFFYDEHSFSLDSAIGPPKSKKVVPASSAKIRHLAQYIDGDRSPDHELWSILGTYGVAEKWSSVEEHAVIRAIKAIIPENVNPKWVDLSWIMETRKLLLRYCRPDELGLVWTNEWWTF